MNHQTFTILGIAGSLRENSYNRAALRAACQLAPAELQFEIFDLAGIPLFNEDDERTPVPKILEFKQRIRSADGLLLVTPEYNHSIPGVLKNAIDWASRPGGDNAWTGKPAAIMGASLGRFGTVRAQEHLRQVLKSLNVFTMSQPEIMIGSAAECFDEQGHLYHQKTEQLLQRFLEEFRDWMQRLSSPIRNEEELAISRG
jgi:chromate reductase